MTTEKNKVDNDKKLSNDDKFIKLVDLKYKFDILANELFYLKDYISLIEFDPRQRNDTDSYDRFLERENIRIIEGDIGTSATRGNRGSNRRSHRHQLRAASVTPSGSSERSIKSSHGLDDIDILVQQKFKSLQSDDDTGEQLVKVEPKAAVNTIRNSSRATKGISNGLAVKEEPKKLLMKKVSIKEDHKTSDLKRKRLAFKKEPTVRNNFKTNGNETKMEDLSPLHEIDDNDSDEYYFTTSSEEDNELVSEKPLTKKPHVVVTLSKPKQTITNPSQVVVPKFEGLKDFMDSFKTLDEDMTLKEYNDFIDEQRKLVKDIRKGLDDGLLVYDIESQTFQPVGNKKFRITSSHKPEPISYIYKEHNKHVYHDYLINQGIFMSKLFQNSKKARIARAKKVSQMIEQHFKHIAGAEERKLREEEKRKKSIVRTMTQSLRKRWTLAERAYRVLRKDEEEQLKRIQGKKHLSKILERSTQLLGAQLNQGQDSENVGSDNSGSTSDASDLSINSRDSDDNLSSSGEEDNENEVDITKNDISRTPLPNSDDNALTVEELRSRYESIDNDDKADDTTDYSVKDEENNSGNDSGNDSNAENLTVDQKTAGLEYLFTKNYSDNNEENESSEESGDYEMSEDAESLSLSDSDEGSNIESDIELETSVKVDEEINMIERHPEQLSVVDVPVPPLLRGTLRIYQKQGLNWLASLYNNNTNGILADEMGLGKTIQTISLLAYLACEKENWGPHLIVVPTSVLLNWEMEFKRFAPGLKVLTYYGTPQQRKEKRKGWNKPDAFHVCIVSYQLVVQDQHSFKRKRWEYMILDEAHNIKNFRSTRWQALLNFNTKRRLLLTGTPLQNNLAELWSLLYFLMPQTVIDGKKVSGFADLEVFQQWFGHPVDKIIETSGGVQDEETKKTVTKLHQVLRPYLLRRLKADVEKQMPGKYEHIVYCRLSKRQRYLYDDFMARSKTKETLTSGNFMSIVNCLMQLRKVCNHPDLFEVRPILTSFESDSSVMNDFSMINKKVMKMIKMDEFNKKINFETLGLEFSENDKNLSSHLSNEISKLNCGSRFKKSAEFLANRITKKTISKDTNSYQNAKNFFLNFGEQKVQRNIDLLNFQDYINELRCNKRPVYGQNLIDLLTISDKLKNEIVQPFIKPLQTRFTSDKNIIDNFAVLTPKAVALDNRALTVGLNDDSIIDMPTKSNMIENFHNINNPFHHLQTKLTIAFPDKSLLQYDCGKLQKLAILLQDLKDNGHRALIFTQMTKVLDILEQFLNYHGYLYMRLDGATKVEDRQILTERFNSDDKVTVFILSSRSGGLGINLTGADTVIFYDSDWNPAMDKQCQDRCHRIGQTRDVHIYRFVSEHTIESNILKKANQKRQLDNVVIQEGDFTTDYFGKLSITDLLGAETAVNANLNNRPLFKNGEDMSKNPRDLEKMLAQAEDADDVKAANLAMKEVEVDDEDFTENLDAEHDIKDEEDEYEGTHHVEEYMIRMIANGYYY
ncbi:similar to Saccharomyces cerevisiae YDR334W SWR1 Swi2/Snf2-related ATPase that is the structural component of the SWR1 complex [Maudiozyma barnettii]|uniref:Helicase SWR1 n=1 Tax=Maudiozyma barnettii TaxID=61262 RepID=A0A8H2VDZ4_9SACH|nr:chromatin-remodeling protein SWR1 [Kazachstania barnettii]CAB4253786.1 similar to Saccharomyces cerevisiae YDR334W SWR1 Swi2/Snf2-related ATPase that is the structural component of the SWR1 complex [Kazachstania barnettii]CAD1781535.1 similar to Saccharomyces cerevisiae YDR334W SWR1 Swi2/Snf2-related ATPase that is the structural component of the SWR1 complex [Kazachstania barnettii]